MNPLYSQLNGQQNQNNPLMALLQLKQNPQAAVGVTPTPSIEVQNGNVTITRIA